MVIIFTDLDGTLLNSDDYGYDEALPLINQLQRLNIPIIPVTSKTREEVISICDEIGLKAPFIAENGSGIFVREGDKRFNLPLGIKKGKYYSHILGFDYGVARDILQKMGKSLKVNLVGFGDLSCEEVCQLTGLSIAEAELAKNREFSEPFLTPQNIDNSLLLETASLYQCNIVLGDRFSHLISKKAGKGKAMEWLLSNYKLISENTVTIGLGNSPNDISLLENVDIPIIIPGQKGVHRGLQNRDWIVASTSGCLGWFLSLKEILTELGIIGK
jgi:mannosyl-3-phosphoglycerate phosphatase